MKATEERHGPVGQEPCEAVTKMVLRRGTASHVGFFPALGGEKPDLQDFWHSLLAYLMLSHAFATTKKGRCTRYRPAMSNGFGKLFELYLVNYKGIGMIEGIPGQKQQRNLNNLSSSLSRMRQLSDKKSDKHLGRAEKQSISSEQGLLDAQSWWFVPTAGSGPSYSTSPQTQSV